MGVRADVCHSGRHILLARGIEVVGTVNLCFVCPNMADVCLVFWSLVDGMQAAGVCISYPKHVAAGDTGSKPGVVVLTVGRYCWCDASSSVVGSGVGALPTTRWLCDPNQGHLI